MNKELDDIKARVAWTKQVPTVAVGVIGLCDYVAALEELIIPITHALTKASDKATAAVEKLTESGGATTTTLEAHQKHIEAVEARIKRLDRTVAAIDVKTLKRIVKLEERATAIDLAQLEAVKEKKCCEPS